MSDDYLPCLGGSSECRGHQVPRAHYVVELEERTEGKIFNWPKETRSNMEHVNSIIMHLQRCTCHLQNEDHTVVSLEDLREIKENFEGVN